MSILYKIRKNDGCVSIMQILGETTPEEEIAKWNEADRTAVVSIAPIEAEALPQDRYFRNAWRHADHGVEVDFEAAKQIKMNELRGLRNAALKALDVDYVRADEKGDVSAKKIISDKKQQLRDLPQQESFIGVDTLEQLKDYTPPILL